MKPTENETARTEVPPKPQTAPPVRERPVRRVGTFTFGLVLVAAGIVMACLLLFPELDPEWILQLSPLFLISLGAEVLLAARDGGKVRYDWVGMILCVVIVILALMAFGGAWWLAHIPQDVWTCW